MKTSNWAVICAYYIAWEDTMKKSIKALILTLSIALVYSSVSAQSQTYPTYAESNSYICDRQELAASVLSKITHIPYPFARISISVACSNAVGQSIDFIAVAGRTLGYNTAKTLYDAMHNR